MTNRLQKVEKAINSMSDDRFNELLNELGVKEDKRWVPEIDEYYWVVKENGYICYYTWSNNKDSNYRLLMKNVFKTKEEAEAQRDFDIEKAKLIKEIEDSSDVIDWEDSEQEKYSMYYIHDNGIIDTDMNRVFEMQGTTYTTNKKFLEYLIKNESERVKKYLFEVK